MKSVAVVGSPHELGATILSPSPLSPLKFRPILLALFVSAPLWARGEDLAEAWANRYRIAGRSFASGRAVKVDAEGNVIAAGRASGKSSLDCYVAKYAGGDGALLWESRSHGPRGSSAWTSGIALDTQGNVALVGTIYDKGRTPEEQRPYLDYYIARFAAKDGALLWERRYDGPAHRSDYTRAVAVDAQGNVFVTGNSEASGPGPGEDFDSLRKNPPRGFFMPTRPDGDIVTLKFAAEDGKLLWERRYDAHHGQDFVHSLRLDAKGNVVVAGTTERPELHSSGYLAKYAGETGESLWEKQIGDGDMGSFSCPGLDTHGDLLVTGSLREVNKPPSGPPTITDKGTFIAKYAGTDGTRLWQWQAPPGMSLAAAFDAEGAVLIHGRITGQGAGSQDYTAKLSRADGKLLWSATVPRSDKINGRTLTVDAHGDLFVAGALHRGDNMGDLYAAKYSGTDGRLLWSHITEGPLQAPPQGGRTSGPYSTLGGLALTRDGGVVICGDSVAADRTVNCMATIFFAPVGRAPKDAQPERALTTHGTTMPGGTTLTYSAPPITPQKPSSIPGKLRALEAWRRKHFGDRAGIEAFAGDRADPNRNGIINLLEYALGGDPLGPGGMEVLPQLEFDENGRARLRFHRYASHDDLLMIVSAADNPSGPWSPLARSIAGGRFFIQSAGAAAEESGETDKRTVLVTDVFSAGDPTHPQRYLRLEVIR